MAYNNKEAVMDTAIKNGDFETNHNGLPIAISGVQELLQRAMFRLTVKKGSFFYDQQLEPVVYLKGSYGNREALSETAMQMVRSLAHGGDLWGCGRPGRLFLNGLRRTGKQMELEVLL
ncbi:MAG: hypothetical protein ACLRVT_08795 [Oscillospiraceae bacterium]